MSKEDFVKIYFNQDKICFIFILRNLVPFTEFQVRVAAFTNQLSNGIGPYSENITAKTLQDGMIVCFILKHFVKGFAPYYIIFQGLDIFLRLGIVVVFYAILCVSFISQLLVNNMTHCSSACFKNKSAQLKSETGAEIYAT